MQVRWWIRSDSFMERAKKAKCYKIKRGKYVSNPEEQKGKKTIQNIKMAKEFGRVRCPIVSNALTLEAYISCVAHMLSVGVFAIICCCLSLSAEVWVRTIAIVIA